MPKLIDTHCHLAHARLRRQLDAVLDRARQAGVEAIVCAAGDLDESREASALAGQCPCVWSLAGVHPHVAKDVPADYLAQLESVLSRPGCVALGEAGLDYHYTFSPPEVQRRVFAEQLALARRTGRKVVVHTREAFDETLSLLRESGVDGTKVLFHSFTETGDAVRRALDLGATISFSGIVTFRKADALRSAAAQVPDDRLLIETDAPYLSPEPVRRMPVNEPANVLHVAACLAPPRGRSVESLARTAADNARRFFGLGDWRASPG